MNKSVIRTTHKLAIYTGLGSREKRETTFCTRIVMGSLNQISFSIDVFLDSL
jgi:hypothetical protein